jgi:hypothetical protein
MGADISLRIGTVPKKDEGYPSSRLETGLVLVYDGVELNEEGVGFGVPIYKSGHHTIFPGALNIDSHRDRDRQTIHAVFMMNLEERITRPEKGRIESKSLYRLKNTFAWMMRETPMLRGFLSSVSKLLRTLFNWSTAYEEVAGYGDIKVDYTIDMGSMSIEMKFDLTDLAGESITEVIVMNEQGANYFDRYQDSEGTHLRDSEIGIWDAVTADWASFICDRYNLAFGLTQMSGARLFRGRELVGDRLAWAGFGYSFSPSMEIFHCTLHIERSQ